MKVICVKAITTKDAECDPNAHPEVGDTDSVIDDFMHNGDRYFSLERFGMEDGFMASHFATVPDTTADEMAEEEKFIYEPFSC